VAKQETLDKAAGVERVLVQNRRAAFDYEIGERFEGGLVLLGSEVKSLKDGKAEIVDAFGQVERGELYLRQLYVAPFSQATAYPHEPRRPRKVLVHRDEIDRLEKAVTREGCTIVPIRIYLKKGRIKVELGVAKGRKKQDKRQAITEKTMDREARKAIRGGKRE